MGRDSKSAPVEPPEERGGYPSGDRLISELKPPPPGPAPGASKPPPEDSPKQ